MKPSWHPTPEQECLLEACLGSGDRAATALKSWLDSVDLQRVDGGSYRLLPLLATRNLPATMDPGALALIKGVYRRTWYHNQLLLAEGRTVATALDAAGIPTMLLKGGPLSMAHYRDIGARPMGDLDLAVPVGFARQAVELMIREGWTPEATPLTGTMTPSRFRNSGWCPGVRTLESFDERYFNVRHAHGFKKPSGLGIDLHWHIFQGDCDPDSDAATWRSASRVTHSGCSYLLPSPHEHLLLILVHASRWSPSSSIRWVADAVTLVRTSPHLDWEAFVAAAVQRRQTCAAGELLAYLAERFREEIPADMLRRLAVYPATRQMRGAYRQSSSRPTPLTGWEEIRYLYSRYRVLRGRSPEACPPGFPRFLCSILGAEHPWQVLDYSVREGIRRLRGIR